jgi:glycosyltransferase involved in cell wall biosynthesis
MTLRVDHLSFASVRDSFRVGYDFSVTGMGWYDGIGQGSILVDVACESANGLQGVCQTKIAISPRGEFSLDLSVQFRGDEIGLRVQTGDVQGICSGRFNGDWLIFTWLLLDGAGNLAYEYKLRVGRSGVGSKALPDAGSQGLSEAAPVIRIYAPTIVARDAIGNYCSQLSELLKANGYVVQLYAYGFDISASPQIRKCADLFYEIGDRDLLFVVYSTYDPWISSLVSLPQRKALSFQNVTPAEYFRGWDARSEILCANAVEQFRELGTFDLYFASTEFTAQYLNSYLDRPKQFLIVPPFALVDHLVDRRIPKDITDHLTLLCVGRVVPNKNIEGVLRVFSALLRLAPGAILSIVGAAPIDGYLRHLKALIDELDIPLAAVHFEGSVSDERLAQYYADASVLLCMSKHEGFCVPVFEAMSKKIAVFALNQPAVKEVMGGSGMGFDPELDSLYEKMAQEIVAVCQDRERYVSLVERQFSRARELATLADGTVVISQISKIWE